MCGSHMANIKVLLKYRLFLDSSAVEQQTVNLLVRGSIPRRGAKVKGLAFC